MQLTQKSQVWIRRTQHLEHKIVQDRFRAYLFNGVSEHGSWQEVYQLMQVSVLYNCFVQEDDKQGTLYIQFATWNVPCHVIVYAVIWGVSKGNILFAILVLLMQLRNILSDVKRGIKKKKKEKTRGG